MAGYEHYRTAAIEAIEAVGATPVAFERFGGRDSDPEAAYLAEVSTSTIYVGLLGGRYGKPLPDRFSATHAEYNHAEREGSRLSMWVEEGVDREGPQQSFFEAVRVFDVTGSYSSPEDLKTGLARRLREIAAEDLSPWCKLGPLVFRAREITESRDGVVGEATVHDPGVSEALQAMNEPFARRERLFTYSDGCLKATIRDVQATTRAARDTRLPDFARGRAAVRAAGLHAERHQLGGDDRPSDPRIDHGRVEPARADGERGRHPESVSPARAGRRVRGGPSAACATPPHRDLGDRARHPADHELSPWQIDRGEAPAEARVAARTRVRKPAASGSPSRRGRRSRLSTWRGHYGVGATESSA